MKGGTIRLLILILLIVAIIAIAAGSFALAYWSGSPSQDIVDSDVITVDDDINATTKYLVFKPIGSYSDDYCFEYTDTYGWRLKYEYGDEYEFEGGSTPAGSRYVVATSSILSEISTNCTAVSVIGYIGTLGQFEDLVIPSTITWFTNNTSGTTKTLNVTTIDLKTPEYEDSLNLITSVVIPSSVTAINGVSFSGAGNLAKVYFDSTVLPATIGANCFRGINATYYKKSSGEYITTTIR